MPSPGEDPTYAWAPPLRERRRAAGAPAITGIVHTWNEERYVGDALRSLAWADELVVVDMESSDATVEIARAHGARVYSHEHTGYVEPARNFGIAQATGDWLLILDADERVPEALAEQLTAFTVADAGEPLADALWLPRENHLLGRVLVASGWGGESQLRFFRRGRVRWHDAVHSLPAVDGRIASLPPGDGNALVHLNYRDLEQFVEKLNRYTAGEAETLASHDVPASWEGALASARAELAARWSPGADGTRSVALSLAMFFYRVLAHAKHWERLDFPEVGAPEGPLEALRDLGTGVVSAHRRALGLHEAGDAAGAAAALQAAVATAVGAGLLNDWAVALAELGDGDAARALLRTAALVDPGDADVRANLAALVP